LFMFIGTLKLNKTLQFIFGTLLLLFILLVIGNYTVASGAVESGKAILNFAGYEGIICGASAIYLAAAEVLNEVYGREVLPIGAKK